MVWDAVTKDVDGQPLLDTQKVVYETYLKYGTDAPLKASAALVDDLNYTFTFDLSKRGEVFGCVEAVTVNKAKFEADPQIIEIQDRSDVVCSDVGSNTSTGEPWAWILWTKPANPKGLSPQ
jgi:hypothetical protein